MSLLPLDGPAVQDSLTATGTYAEIKIGASPYDERKAITLQPLEGKLYVTFETGKPGFLLFKYQIMTFEASSTQPLYFKTVSGSSEAVIVAERA